MAENDAPHTEGGESGTAQPVGGTNDKGSYDKWFGVGRSMEKAKEKGGSY